MTVEHVAAQVVEVLARAESLFSTPAEGAGGVGGRRARWARRPRPAARSPHGPRSCPASSPRRMPSFSTRPRNVWNEATAADARLADHLGAASQTHGEGGAQAAELRAGAADVPARLAPWEHSIRPVSWPR